VSNKRMGFASITCAILMAAALCAKERPARSPENGNQKLTEVQRTAWPPETLNGTITMVDPTQHLVVVQDSSGVPFDMVVTGSTRIRSGNQRLTLGDLTSDLNKSVSLRFKPERRGDVARSIQLNG
jgi:hypothetical protein